MPNIRLLNQFDAEAFITLRAEALEQVPQAFMHDYNSYIALPYQQRVNEFYTTIASTDQIILGAFNHDTELVGIGSLYQEREIKLRHRANIGGVYVSQHAQSSGLGRAIVTALIEQACNLSEVEQIHISVMTVQHKAKALYLSLGFETYGREPHALKIGGEYFDDDLMVLFLPNKGN